MDKNTNNSGSIDNGRACGTCKNWQPRQSGQMARHRFALCALGPRWRFLAPSQTCEKHAPVTSEQARERVVWIARS